VPTASCPVLPVHGSSVAITPFLAKGIRDGLQVGIRTWSIGPYRSGTVPDFHRTSPVSASSAVLQKLYSVVTLIMAAVGSRVNSQIWALLCSPFERILWCLRQRRFVPG
jgi:hypothetical protein